MKTLLFLMLAILSYPAQSIPIPPGPPMIISSIHPGEKLVVEFAFAQAPTTGGGPVDFISFTGGGSYTDFFTYGSTDHINVLLFDADTLLGTGNLTSPSQSCCTFISPGSPGASLATIDVDMTSIIDGSIDGRLEFIPFFEAPTQYSEIFISWQLYTGKYVGFGSYWIGTPEAVIERVSTVSNVPEPNTLYLVAGSFIALLMLNKQTKRIFRSMRSQ